MDKKYLKLGEKSIQKDFIEDRSGSFQNISVILEFFMPDFVQSKDTNPRNSKKANG
jgi:hypothetical protein